MNFEINKLLQIRATAFFILIAVILLAGCASNQMATKQTEKGAVESIASKLITQISTTEDSEAFSVGIKGNQLLSYTSVKQPVPLGVLLYFPETALGDINTTYMPESDLVGSINASELTDKGHTSRIEIALKQDASYEVIRQDNDLKVIFNKVPPASTSTEQVIKTQEERPAAETQAMSAAASTAAAIRLESISSAELADSINIFVNADGTIKDYKFFITTSPARIIFDLFGVKSPFQKEQTIPVGSKWVKTVRHYGYPDRVRVVLDTAARYLSAVSANSSENGLVIQVGSTTKTAAAPAQAEIQTAASPKEVKPLEVDESKPAWVNRIDFSSEEAGKSTIIIGTTKPIQYDIKKINEKKLLLNLYNTNIPEYRQRPMITTRFASAVDRITPLQTPKMKEISMISIELRESVPYVAEQVSDLLMLHFEASSIPPKTLDEAKLPPWKKVTMQPMAATADEKPEIAATATAAPQPSGKYAGEKIALNFYQTDIKNVFRILMDVSKKNFAIDKDVSGSVTLTFDKPVPWDQVLDLVLRMNMLGMVYEGDIVRIATQKTLEQEATQRQSELATQQKTTAQKIAAEPLLTEFISVNYADASADVLPHIVLTEGRGSITVDTRNNQIIITDVAEKIKQAKETVEQIDKVTPQVIIEARIVEATNTFSRDLGTQWQVTGSPAYDNTSGSHNAKFGGDLAFDMSATNPPASSLGQLGITFLRTAGSQISIVNAQIAASESKGMVKIISSPKILTLDNTPATIKQGLSYPFNKLDADGNTTTEFKDIALELEVTPHVTPDHRISMEITVKNNEIGAVINNQISFTTKEASTKLLVNDGDTVIIGGIRKATKRDGVSGVPGLKDIPLLGWFFKRKNTSDDLEELLIFITPRIVILEQRDLGG
ncbi:MAG: type IV pilus secretin PilQ [Desulfobacterales bacterium]|uniref:Type IV pilus secretin PilQ n=1 Tax=Candidatus Desulfatibia vada TaxID=2841696 RepID=A0A8J6P2B5_9BACT|nr:type IV pilus secretin PilQ [Candidatus Desulfatibia vada]